MKTIYRHVLFAFLFFGCVCFMQAQNGNFTTLQSQINQTAANGTLTLDRDYVAAANESRLTITENITIDLNGHIVNRNLTESRDNGNVFFVNSNVTLTINDSNPTASHSPAVTYISPITNEEKTIVGGIIMGGNTINCGGGIEVATRGRLTMNGGTIANNHARRLSTGGGGGGGIYCGNNCILSIKNSKILNNIAFDSIVSIANGSNGGGIFISGTNELSITNSDISDNYAHSCGGGISFEGQGKLELIGNQISGNSSDNMGGGLEINVSGNLDFTLKDCDIHGNESSVWGGGIRLLNGNNKLSYEIDGNRIYENRAGSIGGGIYMASTSLELRSDSIFDNAAGFCGGGVGLGNNCTLVMKEGFSIAGNASDGSWASSPYSGGGGVYCGFSIVELDGALIANNTAKKVGGGVYITSNGTFNMKSGSITNNRAEYGGGGVSIGHNGYTTTNVTMNMTGGTIENNTTSLYGGGVFIKAKNSTFSMTDGSISLNSANYGGGVSIGTSTNDSDNPTMDMTGGSIDHNSAISLGGGVYNCSALTVSGGTISDNSAHDGGGVANMNHKTFIFLGGSILRNEAVRYGGGVMNQGTVNFSNGTISYNQTTSTASDFNGGGGIYNHGDFFMECGTISNNTSVRRGGGVYNHVTFSLKGGTISDNRANDCGGGVYNSNNGTFTMENGSISRNSTTRNFDYYGGGGVYNDKTFTLIGGTISENTTVRYGGGVSNARNFFMQGGTISSNSSRFGGGVYNHNNASSSTAVFTLTAGQIINNTAASGQANGVYQSGIFNLSGAPEFTDHDDIYLYSNKTKDDSDGVNYVITKAGDINRPEGYFHIFLGYEARRLYHGRNILESGDGTVVESDRALLTIDNFDQCKTKFLWDRYLANDPTTSAPIVELFSPTWVGIVTEQPAGFNLNNIDSKEDLAWLISYVNGYNGQQAHPNATAKLTADVDMGEYEWVPIGTGARPFSGSFDGQGNTISNLRNTTEYVNPGMFGTVSGTVKNTFVASSSFVTRPDEEGYYGIIADTLTNGGNVIYSEAVGTLTASASNAHIGGVVGLVSGTTSATHSCLSIADLTGFEMGGLACRNEGSVANSLSYPKFTYSRLTGDFVGGLVADNSGTVSNCYLRRDRGNNITGSSYEPLVAYGAAAIDSYEPADYSGTQRLNGKYRYGQQDQMVGDQCLLDKLNDKVVGAHARWTRTMASPINNDYPVLALPDFTCVAQTDTVNNLFMEYKADLNTMIRKYNATTNGTHVCLYDANATEINTNNSDEVKVYVCENVGLLQAEGNQLNATVGVTFDNSDASDLGGKPYDWHMFATPLQDAAMGISYADNVPHGYMQDPTAITLQANGYFPTDSPYGSMDFYCYSEQYYHWINFKRNSADHWHQDGDHDNIPYTNETTMVPGKGYMMAIDQQTMLMDKGILTNGDFIYPLSYTELSGDEAPLRGCNLIGNPYQSYLDFDELANEDVDTYYILDADHRGYIAYTKGATGSQNIAPRYIHPHQGFFVRATANGQSVTFTNAMRHATGKPESFFRNEEILYPLVNLVCTDANGKRDYATVEFERPESGGGEKVKGLRSGNASIGIHLDDKNYQIAFAPSGIQTVPVHFKAYENGHYTLSWNTENADFSYLHLIDNLTGIDLDCLQTEEYQFAAIKTDYQSRFKLVFQYTGIEEHHTETELFAFPFGDEIIINGEGCIELYDLNGRLIKSEMVSGPHSSISKPNVASGLYLVRLTNNKKTHTQKIIIK